MEHTELGSEEPRQAARFYVEGLAARTKARLHVARAPVRLRSVLSLPVLSVQLVAVAKAPRLSLSTFAYLQAAIAHIAVSLQVTLLISWGLNHLWLLDLIRRGKDTENIASIFVLSAFSGKGAVLDAVAVCESLRFATSSLGLIPKSTAKVAWSSLSSFRCERGGTEAEKCNSQSLAEKHIVLV